MPSSKQSNTMKKSSIFIVVGLVILAGAVVYTLRGTAPEATGAPVSSFSSGVEVNLVKIMENTCEESHKVKSGMLEQDCGRLIDSLQCRGFEVFSKGGDFWAEVNKKMRC